MKLTFGIVTYSGHDGTDNLPRVNQIIDAIEQEEIPEYEIIIVGDYAGSRNKTRVVKFDETVKRGWITRKKNIITEEAKHDIIVYTHDYIRPVRGFYKGWLKFGDDWDIAMNVVKNYNGARYRDWVVLDDPRVKPGWVQKEPWCPPEGKIREGKSFFPSYDYKDTKYMYISGGYWVAKKHVMQEEPLNEDVVWGQAEDVEWSDRIREKYKYVMNTHSAVQLDHYKDPILPAFDHYLMSNSYIRKDLSA
jgi:hypothetical protein